MPNNLPAYEAVHQTMTNRYEQCRSSPTLAHPKILARAPLMVISKKNISKALLY